MNNNVSFDSELCKFGIGLFETIKVKDYIALNIDAHLKRLYNSIYDLEISFKYSKDEIKNIIQNYIKKENIKNKALRLTIFDEGYNISTRDITYNSNQYESGFSVTIAPIIRGNNILHKYKTTNYYENIYTKKYSQKNGFDEGLFIDYRKNILECSMSNIFFIKNNIIYTPSLELPILDGTMRAKVLNICKDLNIEVSYKNIKKDEIKDFEFCFLTNSLMGVMKVKNIDDKIFDNQNNQFDSIWRYIDNE